MRTVSVIFLIVCCEISLAQSPVADFTAVASACINERVEFTNTSVNATSFEWDFCSDDFQTLQENTSLTNIVGLSNGFGYELIEADGLWFGFAVSQTGSKIMRLEFGNSPLNAPFIADLGNPNNLLIFPHEIEIYNVAGTWYGFVTSNEDGQGLVKLNFGSSLLNTPSAVNIGNFGVTGRIWDIRIIKQNLDLILVMAERNSGTLSRVNFRNSFENPIVPASHVFTTGVIVAPGGQTAPGLDVVKANSGWVVLLTSFFDSKIYKVEFGMDILATPSSHVAYTFSGVNQPYRIRAAQEGDDFYAVISNDPTLLSNDPVKVVNFKDLNTINPPVALTHSGLPELIGIDAVRFKGQTIVQGVGVANSNLYQLRFESECGASTKYTTNSDPGLITYSANGAKKIELRASSSSSGTYSIKAATVNVSSNGSPDIDFSSDGSVCANQPIPFSSQNNSMDITSYSWDFGDMMPGSTGPSTTHSFLAGSYNVELTVTNSVNGCSNFIAHPITIYNAPLPNFSLPSATPFCTNQSYQFTNTSTFDPASNPAWEWRLNGNLVSTSTDLTQAFSSTADQQIKLKASIPGCFNETPIQTITGIQPGPLVDFSASTGCQGTPLQFTNNTSGSGLVYSWNFGDGNSSTVVNPANTYLTFGNFNATLQADNGVCQNSTTKPITVYSKPQPNFSVDLPPFSCQGTPSQFNDLTPNPTDSNLASWAWSFGDAANGSSSQRNPLYTYSSGGPYNVTLNVTTNFGCVASVQKAVSITNAPSINFTNSPACINQPTQFTDGSGAGVKSWQWKIDNSTYTIANPLHTFTTSGPHTVQLTITGANDCIGQLTKTVIAPVAVTPNFSIDNACSGATTTFLDVTSSATDPIASRSWDFAGQAIGTGATSQHSFNAKGNYNVKLSTTHQSGCTNIGTKSVTIGASPKSSFTTSTEGGPPPLPVKFSNSSTFATSYFWRFNDRSNSTSVLAEPSFTFNELGDYSVNLTSFGEQGCSDTFTKIIRIVEPRNDLELTNFELIRDQNSGSLRPLVSVKNNGNIAVMMINIQLDLSGGGLIKERMEANLQPNQTFTKALASELLPKGLRYVCAQVAIDKDENLFDNKKCSTLGEEVILFAPYPNPSQGQLYIDWIAASGDEASIVIFNSTGSNTFDKKITASKPGLSQVILDVSNLGAGIYFVVFTYQGFKKTHRFIMN